MDTCSHAMIAFTSCDEQAFTMPKAYEGHEGNEAAKKVTFQGTFCAKFTQVGLAPTVCSYAVLTFCSSGNVTAD